MQPILSSGNKNGVELSSSVRMQSCRADKEWPLCNYRSCDVQDGTGSDGEEDDPLFFEGKQLFCLDGGPYYHGVENVVIVETYQRKLEASKMSSALNARARKFG
jgi:hypothetical protein